MYVCIITYADNRNDQINNLSSVGTTYLTNRFPKRTNEAYSTYHLLYTNLQSRLFVVRIITRQSSACAMAMN